MSWKGFPRIYANLQSSPMARNFNNSRPIYVILWEIRNHYRNIWFMKNSKCQHFLFLKNSPKNGQIFQLFTLYSKGRHFSITKLGILIFCNILHLEIDFEIWAEKGYFLHKTLDKSVLKNNINKKNGIAYSTVRNLKTAYLSFPLE